MKVPFFGASSMGTKVPGTAYEKVLIGETEW